MPWPAALSGSRNLWFGRRIPHPSPFGSASSGSKIAQSTIPNDRQVCDSGVIRPDMAASNCIIAIVEDDASLRRALERLLCASGFGVHTFASAEEFFGSAVPELYGCLILDISAPKEVGFRLIRRSHRVWPTRPVIFVTAQDETTRGSKRPGFPTASTCTSQLSALCCWRYSFAAQRKQCRCGEPRKREAQCGASNFPLKRRKSPADEYVCFS